MSEQIKITLTGIQKDDTGERDINSTDAFGEYYEKNGTHYIFFEEKEDSNIIKSTIKFKNNCLELIKKGAITTRMVFEPGKEFISDYITPFGMMQMSISTHMMECHFKKGLPQLRAAYTLSSGGELVSESIIIIKLERQHP